MSDCIENRGYPTLDEIKAVCGYQDEERFAKGPVAVIECVQEIPCNPCEDACPFGAICVGAPITNIPKLDKKKCTGCGLCVAKCPGLAIFIIDKTYSETCAAVSFPHEFLPLPIKEQIVKAVNRQGKVICKGKIININKSKKNDATTVIKMAVPKEYIDEVRGMKRL